MVIVVLVVVLMVVAVFFCFFFKKGLSSMSLITHLAILAHISPVHEIVLVFAILV